MKKTLYGPTAAALLAFALLVIPATISSPADAADGVRPASRTTGAPSARAQVEAGNAFTAEGLRPEVLRMALEAHDRANARGLVKRPDVLTVIDFSLPSTERRLWVLDLGNNDVLHYERVTHGKNSGANMTRSFSNVSMSLKSNIGLLTTAESYYGKNGYSLRLDGHEPGFNDLARERAIVIHGADYATDDFIRQHGRLGRSWGCPALDPEVSRQVIDTIKGGSVVFGYYPDHGWLTKSAFVDPGTDTAPTRTAS